MKKEYRRTEQHPKMNKQALALQWINAWNQHDLDSIMTLYGSTIRHTSSKISTYFDVSNNTLEGKENLRSYFQQALANNPNLTFDLSNILEGESSVVVLYIRMGKDLAGEYLEFNEEGLIIRSRSHYSDNIRISDSAAK